MKVGETLYYKGVKYLIVAVYGREIGILRLNKQGNAIIEGGKAVDAVVVLKSDLEKTHNP